MKILEIKYRHENASPLAIGGVDTTESEPSKVRPSNNMFEVAQIHTDFMQVGAQRIGVQASPLLRHIDIALPALSSRFRSIV